MALSVNVTVNMPMEMVRDIDEEAEKHGKSRAEYIRDAVRSANGTPFDEADDLLVRSENRTEQKA